MARIRVAVAAVCLTIQGCALVPHSDTAFTFTCADGRTGRASNTVLGGGDGYRLSFGYDDEWVLEDELGAELERRGCVKDT